MTERQNEPDGVDPLAAVGAEEPEAASPGEDPTAGPPDGDRASGASGGDTGAGAPDPSPQGAQGAGGDDGVTSADIESDLDELRLDLEKTTDRYLRLAAEFDNYRKRVERERGDMRVRSQAELAAHLLEAFDDLARVADFDETTSAAALLDGVRLVEKKLTQALESFGLERVDAGGKIFNPETMEGIATVPTDSEAEDDIVSDVFQPGYLFKGQLIRPARVRVKRFEG